MTLLLLLLLLLLLVFERRGIVMLSRSSMTWRRLARFCCGRSSEPRGWSWVCKKEQNKTFIQVSPPPLRLEKRVKEQGKQTHMAKRQAPSESSAQG
jgi:hypothetical protein